MVGMYALKIDTDKPTMVLNLTRMYCPNQRSLVIHEFGHALGLDHEHQRSDFWEYLEKHIDMEKMCNDERVRKQISDKGKASFGEDWFRDKSKIPRVIRKILRIKDREDGQVASAQYDPESIMHYG